MGLQSEQGAAGEAGAELLPGLLVLAERCLEHRPVRKQQAGA